MWKKESETAEPEVGPVGTRDGSKSWTTIDGVITGLTRECPNHKGTVFSPLAVVITVSVSGCCLCAVLWVFALKTTLCHHSWEWKSVSIKK